MCEWKMCKDFFKSWFRTQFLLNSNYNIYQNINVNNVPINGCQMASHRCETRTLVSEKINVNIKIVDNLQNQPLIPEESFLEKLFTLPFCSKQNKKDNINNLPYFQNEKNNSFLIVIFGCCCF